MKYIFQVAMIFLVASSCGNQNTPTPENLRLDTPGIEQPLSVVNIDDTVQSLESNEKVKSPVTIPSSGFIGVQTPLDTNGFWKRNGWTDQELKDYANIKTFGYQIRTLKKSHLDSLLLEIPTKNTKIQIYTPSHNSKIPNYTMGMANEIQIYAGDIIKELKKRGYENVTRLESDYAHLIDNKFNLLVKNSYSSNGINVYLMPIKQKN